MDWLLILVLIALFGAVFLFTWFGITLFARGWQSYEERYIQMAGRSLDAMYLTMPPQHILYLSFASMALVATVVSIGFRNLLLGLILGAMAFPLPGLIIHLLKRRRDRRFGFQLVDALVAMGNALRAGYSLHATFELLAREMPNPMGQEMRMVVQEMQVGVSMDDALHHLYERMPSQDLDLLITSIIISREVGGNLTEIFDNIAETIRERHRIEGKIRALTAQGKIQGIVVALLPVAIGVILNAINPDFMRPMFTTWIGGLMLALIVILELLGAYFIWRIVSIKI